MISSMTGFGAYTKKTPKGYITVEIKTINHKYLDVSQKLPSRLYVLEDQIKRELQKKIRRGKVFLTVSLEDTQEGAGFSVNKDVAKKYLRAFGSMAKELKLPMDIGVKDIINLQGVLVFKQEQKDPLKYWPSVREVLEKALNKLVRDRHKEGKALCKDLEKRAGIIKRATTVIRNRAKLNVEDYRHTLSKKIKALAQTQKLDKGRIEFEVALFAKNCDIAEEITRLNSHLKSFSSLLHKNSDMGKQLDFVAQEMHRETNTIGAKSNDLRISKKVIQIKGEIERIREQLKNIE